MPSSWNKPAFPGKVRRFLRGCLATGPYQRFTRLLAPRRIRANPEWVGAVAASAAAFESDLARWQANFDSAEHLFERLLLAPNLLATYLYRLSHELHRAQVPEIPDVIAALGRTMTGSEIYYSAEIGPGLKLIHGLSTVIGSGCVIGRDVTIYQGVTVGDALGVGSGNLHRPTLGDGVIVCAGSAILGPVEVGHESVIAANSVVLDSIPPRSIASGTPARVMVESLPDSEYQRYRTVLRG